jgi:methylated-DNA-protein-cysteine methyltransferase related protein
MNTPFARKVYAMVAKIPKGTVATYGQIAALAGKPKAARVVGMCMQKNTDTGTVPCHRVVGSDGALTGYAFGNGIPTKKKLLEAEGVVFKGPKVNLDVSGWKPGRV